MTEKTQPSGKIPEYYEKCCGRIEPIELLKRLPFQLGNACKYLIRAPYKESEEKDLKKALDYLTWAEEDREQLPDDNGVFLLLVPFFRNEYLNTLTDAPFDCTPCYERTISLVESRIKEIQDENKLDQK